MHIQLATQLMPQYLPGRVSRKACSRVEMVAANDHRVVAFTLDAERHLTVWLSAEEGFVRWLPIPVSLAEGGEPVTVVDFDAIGNVGQGRNDGTIDLAMVVERPDGKRQLFYWPRIPAEASAEAWRLLFAAAQPIEFPHVHPLDVVRLGVISLPVRCLIAGSYNTPLSWEMFRVSTDSNGHVCTGLDPFPYPGGNPSGGSNRFVLAAAVGKRTESPVLEDGAIVATFQESQGWYTVNLLLPRSALHGLPISWPVRAQDATQSWPPGLSNIQTVLDPNLASASFLFTLEGDGFGNATISLFEVLDGRCATYLPCSVPGLVPAEGPVRVVPLDSAGNRVGRFEHMRPDSPGEKPAQLVLTTGTSLSDPAGASVPLFDDVAAFCACRCGTGGDEPTSLHVMVAYASGGLELFTQDSVSEQWLRFRLTDDNVKKGWHTANSYSTRILVQDDRGAPAIGATVVLRPKTPCFALINGVATHLSPLLGHVVTTDGAGVVNLVQPVNTLGAAMIEVSLHQSETLPHIPPGTVFSRAASRDWQATPVQQSVVLNPMVKATDKLARVTSGTDIHDARASDGRQPFAHLPLAQCNQTSVALKPLMQAYHATFAAPDTAGTPVAIVARTRLHWQGSRVAMEHTMLSVPETWTPGDSLPALGNMLGYLWTLVKDTVNEVVTELEWLSNGLANLVLTIGDVVWRATMTIASQAAELIDWALQKSLGISLDDLVNWLGQVFDWPAILRTQKAIKHFVVLNRNHAVNWLAKSAPAAVDSVANEMKVWLAGLPDMDQKSRSLLERPAASGANSEVEVKPPAAGPDVMWGQTQIAQFSGMSSFGNDSAPAVNTIMAAIESAGQSMKSDVGLMKDWLVDQDLSTLNPLQLAEGSLAILGTSVVDAFETFVKAMLPEIATLVTQLTDAADASVQIPVLSALYSELINPGSELSLLDAVTLLAAIGGHIGSELVSGEPLISASMANRILAASDLQSLLDAISSDTAVNQLTAYNAISTLTSGLCKSLYLILWSLETWGGVRTAATVRWRVIADTFSWLIATSWALVMLDQAHRLGRNTSPYCLNVVYLFIALLINRSKDAVDLYYASSSTPGGWKEFYGYLEVASGFILSIMAIWETVDSVQTLNPPEGSDSAYWKSLIALSSTGMLSTGVYYVLSCERYTKGEVQLALRALRTVVNALRSTTPLISSFLLFKCASEGWSSPGLMSD